MGQIRSLASVCVSVCHRSCGRNFESNLMKLCTVVWGRKSKIEFIRGSKSDNAFPCFTLIFINPNAFSIRRSLTNTAVSTPVDRPWRLIPHTKPLGARTRGALPKNDITPECSQNFPKLCPVHLQWEYTQLTDDTYYLSNDARYTVGYNGTPIRNCPLRVLWSRVQ